MCLPNFPDLEVPYDPRYPMVMGDFNQDNLSDVIIAGKVALARGNGTFKKPVSVPELPTKGSAFLAVDFNADGLLDMVVADDVGHRVGVSLNTGELGFQTAWYEVAVKPSSIAVGDLNGDHANDLVFVAHDGDVLGTMVNAGDGTLLPPKLRATRPAPTSVVVGDFDGDGVVDVAYGAQFVVGELLKNDGKLAFTSRDLGSSADAMVASDLDADGDLDMAFGSTNTVLVKWNDGQGNFSEHTLRILENDCSGWATTPYFFVVHDLNGDGKPELLAAYADGCGDASRRAVWTALNNGDHTFTTKTRYLDQISTIAAGDITGDGKAELLAQDYELGGQSVQVFRNKGDGSFAVPEDHPTTDYAAIKTLVDVTGDNKPDGIAWDSLTNRIFVYPNDGKDSFSTPWSAPDLGGITKMLIGDVNGDKVSDILISDYHCAILYPMSKSGIGTGIAVPWFTDNTSVLDLILADPNEDGRSDLIVKGARNGQSNLYVFYANNDGSFQAPQVLVVSGEAPSLMGSADLNKDGRLDLYGGSKTNGFEVWLAKGGTYTLSSSYPGKVSWNWPPIVVDLDGDSYLDFVQGQQVLHGRSDGTFDSVEYPFENLPTNASSNTYISAVADMDQDGRPDVVIPAGGYLAVRVFLNLGNRKFSEGRTFRLNRSSSIFTVLDLNHDGAMDILTFGEKHTGHRYLFNGCGN